MSESQAKATLFEDVARLYERIAADLGVKTDESVSALVAGIKRPDDAIRSHLIVLEGAIRGLASAEKTRKALQRP